MGRKEEVKRLLSMSPEEIKRKAGGKVIIFKNLDELHRHFARTIADEIKNNNDIGRRTSLILPVGPTGQYPILVKIINREKISLKNCFFFFMDEYVDGSGKAITKSHALSFKREMDHLFFGHINKNLRIPASQLKFPDHTNIRKLKSFISAAGGIDTCYGGIGVHGHVAFNEPAKGVKNTDPRIVDLNQYTVTINAIRSNIGGDLVNFPVKAVTLGLNQIRNAGRIRLFCRNDVPGLDWANLVLRLALFGKPGDDYPVTHLNSHKDIVIGTTLDTARKPVNILPLN